MRYIVLALIVALSAPLSTVAQTTLIPFSDQQPEWKYLDDGSDPGESWTTAQFDDTKWKAAAAPLGYGEEGVRTTIGFGDDGKKKHITAYFRRTVSIDVPDNVRQLILHLRCDDGAVVYVNGQEAARQNMPNGKIATDTLASRDVRGLYERLYHRFVVPGATLVKGKNLLAVETHQAQAASDDLYFDLVVKAESNDDPATAKLSPAAEAVTRGFLRDHYVAAKTGIPDGYIDGGRGMRIDAEGNLSSGRELMVVDRSRDAALQSYLKFAGSPALKAKPPLERATELARYVDREMTSTLGRDAAGAATGMLADGYGNERVLLGEVAPLCSSGACRHRSLLFKILADEAELDVALVRGNFAGFFFSGGHAWNELRLADGKVVLVDVMNPLPDFRFPDLADPAAQGYRTVDDKPYYPPKK